MANQSNPITLTTALLTEQRERYVDELFEFVRSQRELWQQIPLLALKADGRTGYSDAYARAHRQKLWAIDSSVGSQGLRGYSVYVDLETGELVNPYDRTKPASRSSVLHLKIEELDASKLIEALEKQAQVPFFNDPMETEYRRRMAAIGQPGAVPNLALGEPGPENYFG